MSNPEFFEIESEKSKASYDHEDNAPDGDGLNSPDKAKERTGTR